MSTTTTVRQGDVKDRMNAFVDFFKSHGEASEPGPYLEALSGLPGDIKHLCGIVQGLVVHPAWISEYGVEIPRSRVLAEQQSRTVVEMLDTILELDPGPLTKARPPGLRIVGTCRNFSLLLCSILRARGVPARLRCGFAPYFSKDRFEDHWICEYWSEVDKYWVRVDPQLDAMQREALAIQFDSMDIPIDAYLYAGEIWVMCRRGRVEPELCGIYGLNGLGFIKGNIVRDILALNRIEAMPWDSGWGILGGGFPGDVDRDEMGYIDRLARCSANSLVHLAHSFFNDDDKIRFPEGWDLSMAPGLEQLMRTGENRQ
jgi:hypothetical protein